ncbi:MAG: hypothetical protein KDA28_17630, partial [Phycisphaerales bacterium]|nr:hypothetical protein [Phycisphaerales bacterium]
MPVRLYDDTGDQLMVSDSVPERVTVIPGDRGPLEPGRRIRIVWGEEMLTDILDGRYRTVICGVNNEDNSHGIIAQLVNLI